MGSREADRSWPRSFLIRMADGIISSARYVSSTQTALPSPAETNSEAASRASLLPFFAGCDGCSPLADGGDGNVEPYTPPGRTLREEPTAPASPERVSGPDGFTFQSNSGKTRDKAEATRMRTSSKAMDGTYETRIMPFFGVRMLISKSALHQYQSGSSL